MGVQSGEKKIFDSNFARLPSTPTTEDLKIADLDFRRAPFLPGETHT